MSSFADPAQSVQGGNAKRGGEIAVRSASRHRLLQVNAKVLGQFAGLAVQRKSLRGTLHRRAVEAAADLPPQMQRAFRLHKLEGLSHAETAQAMGISVKSVEKHISAALRTLTARLGE